MTLVLIVEDKKEKRELRSSWLKDLGCKVVSAESTDEAVRRMRYCPNFDLVITDINFKRHDDQSAEAESDTSGIALGQWIADEGYPTVSAGYSGHFNEGTAADREAKRVFKNYAEKGRTTATELMALMKSWISMADAEKAKRLEEIKLRVVGLADLPSGKPVSPDFNRVLTLKLSVEDGGNDTEKNETLTSAGYTLEILEPISQNNRKIGLPFLAWVNTQDREPSVEVFQQPLLYSSGNSLEEALEMLSDLMSSYFFDLKDDENLGPGLNNLRYFLTEIFEGE